MLKVNVRAIPESFSMSPKGRYARGNKDVSVALGRNPDSSDLRERLPFDVQICRIPAGKRRCPYHLHTSQFEYFQVLSGSGTVRHKRGETKVEPGDAFQFAPGEPHQLSNDGMEDFVVLIVADNPLSEACYYPDSDKWLIEAPGGPILKSPPVDYFEGEE
jgi:mannose-6-phosphate isomerase-like protein (cupin superfamily)